MIKVFANRSDDLREIGQYLVAVMPVNLHGEVVVSGEIAGFRSTWGLDKRDDRNAYSSHGLVTPPEGEYFASAEDAFLAALKEIEQSVGENAIVSVV